MARIVTMSIALVAVGLSLSACVSPGTRPLDMSASEHDRAARDAEAAAYDHASRAAQVPLDADRCKAGVRCRTLAGGAPIDDEQQEAQRLLWVAAEHRDAARSLRDEEAAACRGVPRRDLAIHLFEDRRLIDRVEPLRGDTSHHMAPPSLSGAVVTFTLRYDLDDVGLERLMRYHVAAASALGVWAPEALGSPAMVPGARFTVRRAARGLAVEFRAGDSNAAAEVLRRALALVDRRAMDVAP